MKNIIIRSLSGIVYVALIVAAIILLDKSCIAYLAIFSLFIVLGINEIHLMTRNEESESWLIVLIDFIGGMGMMLSLYVKDAIDDRTQALWLVPIAGYIIIRSVIQLYRPKQNALHSLERSFFAMMYVALPIAMMSPIITVAAPRTLLGMFVFIWINDTGAFLTGMTLGKHKLFERISPKKTWEGFIGGVLSCMIAAVLLYKYCNEFFQVPNFGIWIGLSVVVSISATFGDLVESLLKRTIGVKDSGHLIPGHGGILDRIDSLLLVVPATLIYLTLLMYNN